MAPKSSKGKISRTLLGYLLFGFVIPSLLVGIGAALYFAAGLSLPMTGTILVGIIAAGLCVAGIVYLIARFQKNNSKLITERPSVLKSPTPEKSPEPESEPKPKFEAESETNEGESFPHGSIFQDIPTGSQGLLTIDVRVDKHSFDERCKEMQVAPSRVVFIFPGNSGHHTRAHTLFSVKEGIGLGEAARKLGEASYATLSLPTTAMDSWHKDDEVKMIVHNAIADLYKAAGAEFSLMLPVRPHQKNLYFKSALSFAPGYEPSFWGGVIKEPNPPLAKHYVEELEALDQFLKSPAEDKKNSPFYAHYLAGQKLTGRKDFAVSLPESAPASSSKTRSP